jgi:uncharacterized protein
MGEYAMLDNIRAHSIMVARVAQVLLQRLADSPITNSSIPSDKLVLAGALLHDIAKTPCLESRCDHARHGRDICLKLGYPAVAEVVREHVILMEFSVARYEKGHFFAKELVYYADKRVRHDEIVSINERLDYILENYGKNDSKRCALIQDHFEKCRQLENFLFSAIEITADSLQKAVSERSSIL